MKVLVAIQSYGTGNGRYLLRLIEEYRSMSFDVDIVVLSNTPKEVAPGVEVVVIERPKSPWPRTGDHNGPQNLRSLWGEYRDWKRHLSLPFPHKHLFADRMDDYDLFIYSEDDTLLTERNLRAFLDLSAVLPDNEIPGFFRFEERPDGKLNFPEVHGHFHWDPLSVRSRGKYTLAFFTNEHAACYALTREQLRYAIDSGGFLVGPHKEKYDLLCTAATDPYTQCGMRKLICVSHIEDFLIHHLPNKYVGTRFGVDDAELRRQLEVLLRLGNRGHRPAPLFPTETKLPEGLYSKCYYEPVQPEVIAAVPGNATSVLSIGCGWGATEASLAAKGMQVTAIPLDPLIPGGAEGVEIVTGDFREAREQLAGRRFDCLLFSNVLHLTSNPVEVLSSFGELLSVGGVSIAVVPNTGRLAPLYGAIGTAGRMGDLEKYRKTGVHLTSADTVRRWFWDSGMQVERLGQLLRPRAQRIGHLTLGLMNRWLAYEFVAVATRV